MQTFFEVKVKFMKINQEGYERKVTDIYLLDAVSYTDAETRINIKMAEITSGMFQVKNIRQSNITEIIASEDGEWWYKAKIQMISLDEESGKEKKINNYILVMADDIDQGLKRIEEGLSYMLAPFRISSITLSPICDVMPYFDVNEKP